MTYPPRCIEKCPTTAVQRAQPRLDLRRRRFVELAGVALSGLFGSIWLLPGVVGGAGFDVDRRADRNSESSDTLVTEVPGMAGLVEQLEYVNHSPREDQSCANCRLFTPDQDVARGACTLFRQGVVRSEGWCNSWVEQTAAK